MRKNIFLPDMYQKNIFNINYSLLKEKGIKVLIFDLDNTLCVLDNHFPSDKEIKLIEKLKKDFEVLIISNNNKKRVEKYALVLKVDFISFALKPLSLGFIRVKNKYPYPSSSFAMIGDQIMTDIYGAKRNHFFTVLVDPISKKDLKITGLNRYFENKILTKYSKLNIFKRGGYYDEKM